MLAAARALQGVAAAAAASASASVPAALRLLTTVIPDGPPRRRAVAWWSAAGAAAGFVVGGVLTELATWRLVFWLTIVGAAVLAVALLAVIPRDHPSTDPVRVGWVPALLLTSGVMGVVLGATLLGQPGLAPLAGAPTAAGALALAGFVASERRSTRPLIPLAARTAPRVRWGAYGSFVNTAATSSSFTVATLYLQDTLGLSPLKAAGLLVSFSVLVVIGSTRAPRLLASRGPAITLSAGLTVIALGNVLLAA